ncbi:MAG: hypothetical protein NZ903_03015 [Candidatus Micrarchaeota archaeon]|nr:hypothetical protein [Candidatus Micrarchaeota archaeon]
MVGNNGERIRRFVKGLIKEGYVLSHKKGEAISLNPAKNREIMDYVKSIFG